MEAPNCGEINPKQEEPFIHHYNLNNMNYEIELNTSSKSDLYIKVTNKSKIENSFFIYESSIENLYKIDKYFTFFENIKEVKENLNEILSDKECFKLKVENENLISIILKANIGKQTKNIVFSLTKKEINNDNLIKELINKINFLENENKLIKNKFKEFEDLFHEEILEKKIMKECLKGDSITTLTKFKDFKLIKDGIVQRLKLYDKNIQLKLIFKSSRDGYTSQDFHKFCDGKGPTISIIETKDNNILVDF